METERNKTNEKLKNYESAVRHRVECEERAFHVVNKLIEGSVEGPYLIKCGRTITRDHYNDIVEERAISLICGYPLCENSLQNIPKKQFHISTQTNKVYDISERKNFCSNQCLRASKHFQNQIPDSPLWTREKEPLADIKLLPHKNVKGMLGDEVVGASPVKALEEDLKRLEELDRKSSPSNKKTDSSDSQNVRVKLKKDGKLSKRRSVELEEEMKESVRSTNVAQEKTLDIGVTTNADTGLNEAGILEEQLLSDSVKKLSVNEDNGENSSLQNKVNIGYDVKMPSAASHGGDVVTNTCKNRKEVLSEKALTPTTESNSDHVPHKTDSEKLDRLMSLLSKRKNVLSGMADIQTVKPKSSTEKSSPGDADSHTGQGRMSDSGEILDLNAQSKQMPKFSKHVAELSKPALIAKQYVTSTSFPHKEQKSFSAVKPKSPLEHIAEVMKTWITDNTIAYLQSSTSSDRAEDTQHFSDPKIQSGYASLCKRLNAQEKELENIISETEGIADDDNPTKSLKSTPDYKALKEEAEAFQLKVTEFLTGKKPKLPGKGKDKSEDQDPVYIPPVDAYNQLQIRVKIVLERIDKCIPDLLVPLCLSVQDVSSFIRELVYTFRLEKDNIVFRPSEWSLASIFILTMLSQKNRNIMEAFMRDSATRYFSTVLKGIGHTFTDVDVLTEYILS